VLLKNIIGDFGLLYLLAAGVHATIHEATQTDWFSGDEVPGPVTDWGDTFDTETNVS
jgi:hypothetical protein